MNADLFLTSQAYLGQNPKSQFSTHKAARNLFNRALRDGLAHRLWGRLSGHSTALRMLTHTPVDQPAAHHRQIASIPLEWIVGSEGRSDDFDHHFHPLKAHLLPRWVGIAIARRNGVGLPPVELVRDGQEYYVRDGHHRISVARTLGQLEIEAVIVN